MREIDHWLDGDEDTPPYDERAFLDGAHDVPDMTPEQQARLWRKLGPRIAAQDRMRARQRRVKQGLRWGLVAACGVTAMALAVRMFGLQPKLSMAPRARFVEERQSVEAADGPDPQVPPPPASATTHLRGARAVGLDPGP
jgi:hypothetical protein